MVLVRLETLCATPCTLPSTLGCGQQLLTRMAVDGRANVRAVTCTVRTSVMPNQIHVPEACSGGDVEDGITARYGASKYVTGNRKRLKRNERVVPSLKLRVGKSSNCILIPITPRIASAVPMLGGGKARPPVNVKGAWGLYPVGREAPDLLSEPLEVLAGLYRGVERNTNQRLLKVPEVFFSQDVSNILYSLFVMGRSKLRTHVHS